MTKEAEVVEQEELKAPKMGENINQGVRILVERMYSHPEEFIGPPNVIRAQDRWDRLIKVVDSVGTDEEKRLVRVGLTEIKRARLTSMVLKTLMDKDDEDEDDGEEVGKLGRGAAQAKAGGMSQTYNQLSPYYQAMYMRAQAEQERLLRESEMYREPSRYMKEGIMAKIFGK